MRATLREIPQDPRVDGACREFSAFCTRAGTVHRVEDPRELRGAEVRIERQARGFTHAFFVAGRAQRIHDGRRASILPDDGAMDRLTSGPIPHDDRLALVRDTNRGNRRCLDM